MTIASLFTRRSAGLLCLFGLMALLPACKPNAAIREAQTEQWSLLAIQDNGRRKPVDTYAKESLLRISGHATYKGLSGRTWEPNEFLLSALLDNRRAWHKEPIILINYRPLVQELKLIQASDKDQERKRFSYDELTGLPALQQLAKEIHELRLNNKDIKLDRRQQEIESVSGRISLLGHIMTGESLLLVPPPAAQAAAASVQQTAMNGGAGAMAGMSAVPAVKAAWLVPPDAAKAYGEERFGTVVEPLQKMALSFRKGDVFNFSTGARELRTQIRALHPEVYPSETLLERERLYNHLGAFPNAAALYIVALLTLAVSAGLMASAPGSARGLRWMGLAAALAGLALHGTGLGLRCAIAGRPPVTNMFESMVWVAFVIMAFGFAFFARYRGLTYLLAALPVSTLTLLAVMNAPVAMPESIDPLVPVLRDNFWLTIHVLTITASYGAFALAMGFGHILLFRYLLNPVEAQADSVLHFWLYRIMQLGILLIATGTILGGVWANYSWGRFWGWDPKETWAFITLMCYIVAVHGRIAGWWRQFGLAVASVVCFAAVLMAWYGVNALGAGLHSYGHMVGDARYMLAFAVLDVLFVVAVCVRHQQAEALRQAHAGAVRAAAAAGNGGVAGLGGEAVNG